MRRSLTSTPRGLRNWRVAFPYRASAQSSPTIHGQWASVVTICEGGWLFRILSASLDSMGQVSTPVGPSAGKADATSYSRRYRADWF